MCYKASVHSEPPVLCCALEEWVMDQTWTQETSVWIKPFNTCQHRLFPSKTANRGETQLISGLSSVLTVHTPSDVCNVKTFLCIGKENSLRAHRIGLIDLVCLCMEGCCANMALFPYHRAFVSVTVPFRRSAISLCLLFFPGCKIKELQMMKCKCTQKCVCSL